MKEADVQRRITALFKQCGGEVYNLAQGYRPGGKNHGTTRQTKGLPDLFVFFPTWRRAVWYEVKKRHDKWPLDRVEAPVRADYYKKLQRPEQATFEALCLSCGVWYVLGGLEEAVELIERLKKEASNVERTLAGDVREDGTRIP